METQRVTIRRVDTEVIDAVRDTAWFNRMTLGEAVSEALSFWLDSLDSGDANHTGSP